MRNDVPGERIIFSNPFRPISDIRFARKMGVRKEVIDCELELRKIKDFYPEAL